MMQLVYFGHGLIKPVWGQDGDRIIAGTLPDGSLVIRTRQPNGSYHVDCIEPAKQEAT